MRRFDLVGEGQVCGTHQGRGAEELGRVATFGAPSGSMGWNKGGMPSGCGGAWLGPGCWGGAPGQGCSPPLGCMRLRPGVCTEWIGERGIRWREKMDRERREMRKSKEKREKCKGCYGHFNHFAYQRLFCQTVHQNSYSFIGEFASLQKLQKLFLSKLKLYQTYP